MSTRIEKANSVFQANKAMRSGRDTGRLGDCFETAIKTYLANRKIAKVAIQGKADYTTKRTGKAHTYEIKTACCETYNSHYADFVIYCPYVDEAIELDDLILNHSFVFSRELWFEFCAVMCKGNEKQNIQSFAWETANGKLIRGSIGMKSMRRMQEWLSRAETVAEFFEF